MSLPYVESFKVEDVGGLPDMEVSFESSKLLGGCWTCLVGDAANLLLSKLQIALLAKAGIGRSRGGHVSFKLTHVRNDGPSDIPLLDSWYDSSRYACRSLREKIANHLNLPLGNLHERSMWAVLTNLIPCRMPGCTECTLESLKDVKAIVLYRDLDAHMAPHIQRSIVPKLRRLFPNVQWFVTTHSPIMVSCFDQHEVFVVSPEELRPLDRPILAFTSDQILSYVFGISPNGEEIEIQLKAARHKDDSSDIEVTLEVNDKTDVETARAKIQRRKELLAKLRVS